MQEPARRAVDGAESPDPSPAPPHSGSGRPSWPVAGARPPHAESPQTSHPDTTQNPSANCEPSSETPGEQPPAESPPAEPSPMTPDPDRAPGTYEPPPPSWATTDPTRPQDPPPPSWATTGSIRPQDFPPPTQPRPEDEPTEPIEGLAGGDEPTVELPIIGRFEVAEPGPATPGRRWLIGAGIAAALLLLAGGGALAVGGSDPAGYREGAAAPAHSTAPAPIGHSPAAQGAASPPPTPGATTASGATAPLDGRTVAGFDLVDGAAAISFRSADLGGDLYRITTPSVAPRVTEENGRIRLFLGEGDAVQVALNARVRWNLRVGGGADLSTIDLSQARLVAVDLAGGANRINLTLPRPDGTLTVRMSGGVSQFDVHTADGVPVRVRLGSGAGQVVLDGTRHRGVAAGALFTPARWNDAVDRIDVNAVAGMSALTVGP